MQTLIRRKVLINDIRNRVKKICKEKKISMKQCFLESKVEEHYFYNCSYLDVLPNTQSLINLSSYLNVSIDYLLFGDENER